MAGKRGLFGVSGAPPPSFHRTQPPSWPIGKWTALSPDLFSERAAEARNMVTERHQKQPQMRGIGSNEAASRIDTSAGLGAKLRENAFILNDIQEKPSGGTRRVTMNAHDLHDQSIGYTPPALDMNSSPRHCRLFPVLPPRLAHASKQNCVYTIRNRDAKAAEGGPMCAPPSLFA